MISKPMINVKDVAKSRAFYRETLGFEGTREGDHYDQLVFKGEEVLQLHFFHAPEFSEMWDIDKPVGNGAIFWFHTDDFDASVGQIRSTNAEIIAGPLKPKYAPRREFWFKDMDGYVIAIQGQ